MSRELDEGFEKVFGKMKNIDTPEDTELFNFMDSIGWVYGKYDDQMWHRFQCGKDNTMSQESSIIIMNLITLHTKEAYRKGVNDVGNKLIDDGFDKTYSANNIEQAILQLTNPTEREA